MSPLSTPIPAADSLAGESRSAIREYRAAEPRLLVLDDPEEQGAFTSWSQRADGSREAVSRFQLSGLHCSACAGIIEAALYGIDGVAEARVNASSARAEVRWDPRQTRPSAMVSAVRGAGYDAAPDMAASARDLRVGEARQIHWRLFVAGFCMMQVMMYAAPAYFAEPGDITPDLLQLLQWASWVLSVPVVVFSAKPLLEGAWRSVHARRISMDVPVAVGIVVTFVASTGATFQPGGIFGHEVYFDSLTMFVFFILGGRYVEMRARHRVAFALESAVARLPETVERLGDNDSVHTVTLRQLVSGDRLRIFVGQAFPADGTLLSGHTQVNEALLTGESLPIPKGPGQDVVAGSLNLLGPVVMRVERLGQETRFEAIVALMRSALTQRPSVLRLADRWAGPFLWAVLLLAALGAGVWSVIDPSRAVWVAVSVLIVTCPCALGLASPSVLLAVAGALARRGVLIGRIDAIEPLSRIDTVFLDKTGTLTEDKLTLSATHPMPLAEEKGLTNERLLAMAGSLASLSAHPLSRSLSEARGQSPHDDGASWRHVEERAGLGLQACTADGIFYRLGSRQWVLGEVVSEGGAVPAAGVVTPSEAATLSEVWFGLLCAPLVRFELSEALRPGTQSTIRRLQDAGLKLKVLSGDHTDRVAALARHLGIDDFQGSASPEAKLAAVERAQSQGRCVAMVGDGLNDAPVLARADVSFAFAQGASVAQQHADAVVLSNRLGDVADAHALSQRAMRAVRQNLAWAAVYNFSCIPLALAGYLPPWAAGLGMAGSSLLVILNATRVGRLPPRTA